jgi:hypothetical protein
MTEERFNAALADLRITLRALRASDLSPEEVREGFTRAVKLAANELSPPRRLPLYDRAAEMLGAEGLGLR